MCNSIYMIFATLQSSCVVSWGHLENMHIMFYTLRKILCLEQ